MDPISRKLLFKTRESAITFVAADAAAPTSGAIALTGKGMANGDLMLCFTDRDGSATPPTLPAGWTTVNSNSTTFGGLVAYKIFNSSTDTTVTFTNATTTLFVAYRGVDPVSPIGNSVVRYTTASSSIYGPLNIATDGTSWLSGATFIVSSTGNDLSARPTGWSYRTNATDATDAGALIDSNGTVYFSSFPTTTYNNASGNDTLTFTVEIKSAY